MCQRNNSRHGVWKDHLADNRKTHRELDESGWRRTQMAAEEQSLRTNQQRPRSTTSPRTPEEEEEEEEEEEDSSERQKAFTLYSPHTYCMCCVYMYKGEVSE